MVLFYHTTEQPLQDYHARHCWRLTQELIRHHQRVDEHDDAGTPENHREQFILEEVVKGLMMMMMK